jgi:hypothetical protein
LVQDKKFFCLSDWQEENKFIVSQIVKEKTNFWSLRLARRKQISCLSDWQGENKFLVSSIVQEKTSFLFPGYGAQNPEKMHPALFPSLCPHTLIIM